MEIAMETDDLTIRVLVEIRDGVRTLTNRVENVETGLEAVGRKVEAVGGNVEALGGKVDAVGRQVFESEVRTATAITDLHGTMREIHVLLKNQLDLRDRVERCEREIDELKKRLS
jgi:archaellum component FlaC